MMSKNDNAKQMPTDGYRQMEEYKTNETVPVTPSEMEVSSSVIIF